MEESVGSLETDGELQMLNINERGDGGGGAGEGAQREEVGQWFDEK